MILGTKPHPRPTSNTFFAIPDHVMVIDTPLEVLECTVAQIPGY